MNTLKTHILFLLLICSQFLITAQQVSITSIDQKGQKIYITYDLSGKAGKHNVKLYVKSSNSYSWSSPLKSVSGDVGHGQTIGNNKQIVWDVLQDRDKFVGDWVFGIEATNVTEQNRIADEIERKKKQMSDAKAKKQKKKEWNQKLENAEKYAHENSIIYLYNKLLPLGFSYARLNKNGVGGYFDIAYGGSFPYDYGNTITNSGSWSYFSTSVDSISRLNENVTGYFDIRVGITKKIYFPLWIYGGLAFQYTKVCENVDTFGKLYTSQGGGAFIWVDYDPILFRNTDQTFWKISPELGLQFKIDKLSIRTGFIINDGLKAQLGAGILF